MNIIKKIGLVLALTAVIIGSAAYPGDVFGCSVSPEEACYTPVVFTEITTQTDQVSVYVFDDTTLKVKNQSGVIFQKSYESEGKKTIRIPQQKAKTKLRFTLTTSYGKKGDTVTKTVKDDGKISSKKVNPSLKKPKIYGKITDKTVSVKVYAGKGETLYIQNGSKVLKKVVYQKKGSQTVEIPQQKAGTKLTFYVADKKGRSAYTTKTVKDVTPPKKPEVSFSPDDVRITVKGEVGTKVYIRQNSANVQGSWLYMGTMLEGKCVFWLYDAGISYAFAGDDFSVRLVDDAGNKSKSAKTGKIKEDAAWTVSGT